MRRHVRWWIGCSVLALMGVLCGPAAVLAQAYPSKPIRFVVPYPPGGASDVTARVLGQKMTEAWGQSVVVENRVGANGILALESVAKSIPDGHTILMANLGPNAIVPGLYSKLPFDPIKDFAPITLTTLVPQLIVVSAESDIKTFGELIARAKAKPGELSYASGGNGTASQLAGELLKSMAGVDFLHVPFKSDVQSTQEALAGRVTMAFPTVISVMPLIKAGRLRPLAVTTKQRVAILPDVPTVSESGVSGYDVVSWGGIMAPANTPKDIIGKLNAEIIRILKLPDVAERIKSTGAEIVGSTPAEFGAYVQSEIAKWGKVAKEANIHLD